MHTIRRALGLGLLVALGLMTGCASTTQGGSIGLQRSQLLLMSSKVVERKGAEAYQAMTSEAVKRDKLNVNPEMTKRVRGIADRLIPHVAVFRKDAVDWQWEVNVFDSDQINAFCMPGGKIGFYSGIIEKLELNDDEIAAIMGHEIGHALREHSREKMSQQLLGQAVVAGLAASARPQNQASTHQLGTLLAQLAVHLPFSRSMESESDAVGLELAARGGYDPAAAVTLWQKMSKHGSRAPEFLATHPSPVTRITAIQALLPTVKPLHEQALASRGGAATTVAVATTTSTSTSSTPATRAATAPTAAAAVSTLAPSGPATPTPAPAAPSRTPTKSPDKTVTAKVSGAESFQLRSRIMSETPSCSPDPAVHVVTKEIGAETYEAECVDGTVLRFTCSFGICKSKLASQGDGKAS